MQDRKLLRKKELLFIGILLALAVGIWVFLTMSNAPPDEEHHVYGEVYWGSEMVKAVPLHIDQIFSVVQNPDVVFEVRDGAIAFIESNCADQVCVHMGFIDSPWHFAACLPNALLLRVQFDEDFQSAARESDSVVR